MRVRERMRRASRVAAMAGTLAFAMAGCGGSGSVGYHGTEIKPAYTIPAAPLTDNTGAPFTLAKDDRDLDVVFFGYTNCPDICKFVMSQLTSAYLHLPEEDRARIRVVFVTTDPARDDPATLTAYLKRYDTDFTGLTGTLPQIERIAKPVGIFIERGQKLASGGYAVEHTTSVIAIEHGEAPLIWNSDTSATHIAADIRRLLDREAA